MARKEKEAFVNELTDRLRTNNNFILTDYKGLNVEKMTDLRNSITCGDKTIDLNEKLETFS